MLSRLPLIALAATLALPLAGCIIVKKGAKEPKEVQILPASTADDRPAGFQETSGPGFWVWRGPKDGWHVRTTTGGKQHNFMGEIAVRGSGVMTDLRANKTELNDRVRGNPSGAAFEFKTAGFQDGIDFKVDPGSCLEFDLKMDGKGQPNHIYIGGRQVNPDSHWFKLCD
ncbi:MAG: hypothetical protein IPK82_15525 [Polyangiaceae bacterium]|nr:hypothetical protein [Polyangiaceae bacterium]